MDAFKVPAFIPQDLLLIQELIGPQPSPKEAGPSVPASTNSAIQTQDEDEDINSSDDDEDRQSEEEIAADLIAAVSDDEEMVNAAAAVDNKPLTDSSVGESSSSDSDSDSDSDEDDVKAPATRVPVVADADDDDDEEGPGPAPANTYFQTKHEVAEVEVPIPDVDEVGPGEVLDRVGEVLNIMDNVAIIRGGVRGSDKALDSDTLLVFDDRKVMGYIYETFGPTTQPLYQVKFSSAFPLNQERVRVGREVFHVPARSNFVFVSQIKAIKGSDASNVYDEEPGDDEIEFSDDEAEAAHRSRLKRKRGESRARSNAPSAASSRASTPNPTLMRDQELAEDAMLNRGAFDEYSPYDIDYSVPGPSSRPAPISYDDPYGDAYTAPDLDEPSRPAGATGGASAGVGRAEGRQTFDRSASNAPSRGGRGFDGRPGGRGRDSRGRGSRGGGGGRERGRGRGGGGDYRGGRQQYDGNMQHNPQRSTQYRDGYDLRSGGSANPARRSLSPTSFAIVRATGHSSGGGSTYPQYQQHQQHQQHQPQQYHNPQQQHGFFQQARDVDIRAGNFTAPRYMTSNIGYAQEHQPMSPLGGGFGDYMNQGYHQYPVQGGGGGGGGFGMHSMPGVQPHINPRFASAFAFGMPQMQAQAQTQMQMQWPMSGGSSSHAEAITPTPSASSGVSSLSEWTVPLQSGSANGSAASPRAPSANPSGEPH